MKEMDQVNEQNLESVAGGNGYGTAPVFMTVANLQSGYLALRNAPSYNYNNEVVHAGPVIGELVQVTGGSVMGTGMTGEPCKYIWVYYAKLGVSGYANANFLVY